jgi:hypothetical protein
LLIKLFTKSSNVSAIDDDSNWIAFLTDVRTANEMLDTEFAWFFSEITGKKTLRTMQYSVPEHIRSTSISSSPPPNSAKSKLSVPAFVKKITVPKRKQCLFMQNTFHKFRRAQVQDQPPPLQMQFATPSSLPSVYSSSAMSTMQLILKMAPNYLSGPS